MQIGLLPHIYKHRYNSALLKNHNNFEKYLIKALQVQIFWLPLHPQSDRKTGLEMQKGFLENFFENNRWKIWWFQKDVLSLHPLSPLKMARQNKGSFNNFWKILPKIFGSFKNMNYLCIAIRSLSLSDEAKGSSKNIFEKSCRKIW